eukprot:TRINITY_DN667_c0_g1_i1.p1 TRINITY_DN667_c0_g1~~TRINITY_DN667_c0_g1_i1.p1  ORF type:complete len:140 (+),score=12.24 TRINITY_DN667_c0_g1_i1:60-479(+)
MKGISLLFVLGCIVPLSLGWFSGNLQMLGKPFGECEGPFGSSLFPKSIKVIVHNNVSFTVEGIPTNIGTGELTGLNQNWQYPAVVKLSDSSAAATVYACGGLFSTPDESTASLNVTCLFVNGIAGIIQGVCTGYFLSWA